MPYETKHMTDWDGVGADLALTDPPFGIGFDGTASNYVRDDGNVVDGYVEWDKDEYGHKVATLCDVLARNTHISGQALIFSGWSNSHIIHEQLSDHETWRVEGKLYWDYNFAPYCTKRPAHNTYEIYWAVKGNDWYYTNECSYDHCTDGEANLSVVSVDRNYIQEREKYPTRLPPKIVKVLLEHFSQEGDTVFDPLAGAGTVGIAAEQLDRQWILGDCNENGKRIFEDAMERLGLVDTPSP